MKVQPEPYNSQISYKAHFVNDKNGYFRILWEHEKTQNTKVFKDCMDRFTKNNPGLEITHLDLKDWEMFEEHALVKLFNHSTAEWTFCFISQTEQNHPLRKIMSHLLSKKVKQHGFYTVDKDKKQIYNQLLDKNK